jgi:PST family polysaccharide transporter
MTLWVVPHIFWSLHGTVVSPWELLAAIYKALLAAIAAAMLTLIFYAYSAPWLNSVVSILLGGSLMLGAYGGILLFVFGQRALFMNVLKGLRG